MRLSDAFGLYQHDCKARNLSPRSITLNEYAFKALRGFMDSDELSALTPQTLRRFFIEQSVKNSNSTSARYWDVIRCFASWCNSEGILEQNPMLNVSKPKKPTKMINPLSADDVEKLLSACGRDFVGTRNRLIIAFLYDTGLRASELCDLCISDLDLTHNTAIIRHGKGDKPRLVYFGLSTAKLLRVYIAHRGELDTDRLIVTQFGQPVDRNRLRMIVVRLGRKAGVNVTTHLLRHSMAVSMIRSGCDVFSVQRLLGHSTLAMTKHYAQLADMDVMDKHRQYSPSDRLGSLKNTGRKKIK